MKAIPYGKQEITQEDIDAVIDALKSDFLTQGPRIDKFEKEFAEYVGCKYAIAVSNGTAALHISALALGVSEGSNVITTPITFAASSNCVLYCGGSVQFADIDPNNYLIDLDRVEQMLASKPAGFYSGLIPVDFAGYPLDMERMRAIADRHGLWIIQDSCHAPGAYFTDKQQRKQLAGNGKYADLTVFSFHPVKHIATGEGGMITTNSEVLYKKLLILRTHGITKDPSLLEKNDGGWYYEMQSLGYNYRITDFQAALGSSQLNRADSGLKRRKEIANRYQEELKGLPLVLPKIGEGIGHAFHLFVIQTEQRQALYSYLHGKNIKVQVHYIPVHMMPYYRGLGWKEGDFPVSEEYYKRCLSLPMYPSLTDQEQGYIIDSLKTFS